MKLDFKHIEVGNVINLQETLEIYNLYYANKNSTLINAFRGFKLKKVRDESKWD